MIRPSTDSVKIVDGIRLNMMFLGRVPRLVSNRLLARELIERTV